MTKQTQFSIAAFSLGRFYSSHPLHQDTSRENTHRVKSCCGGVDGTASAVPRLALQVEEDLQHRGDGPGLRLTAERTVLPVLIGQLREALPWRPEEAGRSPVTS